MNDLICNKLLFSYKIGFSDKGHTLGVSTILGFRGSGSGLGVQGLGFDLGVTFSTIGVGLVATGKQGLVGVGGASGPPWAVPFLSHSRSSGHVVGLVVSRVDLGVPRRSACHSGILRVRVADFGV